VAQTEQQQKKPCFILTCPVLVEEAAAWSDLERGDYYPTVEIFLGARIWNDSEVFSRGTQLISDFDLLFQITLDPQTCQTARSDTRRGSGENGLRQPS